MDLEKKILIYCSWSICSSCEPKYSFLSLVIYTVSKASQYNKMLQH